MTIKNERQLKAAIIDGKEIAREVRAGVREGVEALVKKTGLRPGLAVVLIGEDPASKVYVRNKTRASEDAGIRSFQHTLPETTSQEELLSLIEELNGSDEVHGILVQLPLPAHMDAEVIIEAIAPDKDVDGFHPYNMGRLLTGNPSIVSCTPLGIMRLIDSTGVSIEGREAVVVGRSNIVGKPAALLLLERSATVTICHSRTRELAERVRGADIVIAAVGRAAFIKGGWIKEGAVVIDVGINRTEDGKLVGDVDFEGASLRASFITPVPGGVGPMTIAMLMQNTLGAAERILNAG
ncbi:MAG: bifunctional methylenetetrahydrofolate dehydrogenase/methenyltetrahydrofolate cyclohydrolase FolD [Thermodesulfobacteriota bacterium]